MRLSWVSSRASHLQALSSITDNQRSAVMESCQMADCVCSASDDMRHSTFRVRTSSKSCKRTQLLSGANTMLVRWWRVHAELPHLACQRQQHYREKKSAMYQRPSWCIVFFRHFDCTSSPSRGHLNKDKNTRGPACKFSNSRQYSIENLERSVYVDKSNNDRQCSLAWKHSNCTMGVIIVSNIASCEHSRLPSIVPS